jgi:hypothetical protein
MPWCLLAIYFVLLCHFKFSSLVVDIEDMIVINFIFKAVMLLLFFVSNVNAFKL